jgi:hypothetical protein
MSRNANEVRRQRRRENAGKRLKLCSRCKRVLEKVRRSSGEWRDDDYDAKTAVRSVSADLSGSSPFPFSRAESSGAGPSCSR